MYNRPRLSENVWHRETIHLYENTGVPTRPKCTLQSDLQNATRAGEIPLQNAIVARVPGWKLVGTPISVRTAKGEPRCGISA